MWDCCEEGAKSSWCLIIKEHGVAGFPKCSGKVTFKSCRCVLSHVWPFVTPWSVAHQAPLSMGFPRQEYWNGLPFPSLGDLSDLGIEPTSPVLAGRFFITEPSGNPYRQILPMWIYLEKWQICTVRLPKMAVLLLSVHPHLTRAHLAYLLHRWLTLIHTCSKPQLLIVLFYY